MNNMNTIINIILLLKYRCIILIIFVVSNLPIIHGQVFTIRGEVQEFAEDKQLIKGEYSDGKPTKGIDNVTVFNIDDRKSFKSNSAGIFKFECSTTNPRIFFHKPYYTPKIIKINANEEYSFVILTTEKQYYKKQEKGGLFPPNYGVFFVRGKVLLDIEPNNLLDGCKVQIANLIVDTTLSNMSNEFEFKLNPYEVDIINQDDKLTLIVQKEEYFFKDSIIDISNFNLKRDTSIQLNIVISKQDLIGALKTIYDPFEEKSQNLQDSINRLKQERSKLTKVQLQKIFQLKESYNNTINTYKNEISNLNYIINQKAEEEENGTDIIDSIPDVADDVPNPRDTIFYNGTFFSLESNSLMIIPPQLSLRLSQNDNEKEFLMIGMESFFLLNNKNKNKYVNLNLGFFAKVFLPTIGSKGKHPEWFIGLIPGQIHLNSNIILQTEIGFGKGYLSYVEKVNISNLLMLNFSLERNFKISDNIQTFAFSQISNRVPLNINNEQKPATIWGIFGVGIKF